MEVTLENYTELRKKLVEQNSNLIGIVLNEKEKKADDVLSDIKKEFFAEFSSEDIFSVPPLFDERLVKSRLYSFSSMLPKGCDLHVHDMALLPAKELIGLIKTRPEFYINADRNSFDLKVEKNGAFPEGYIKFCKALEENYYTENEIIENWTVKSKKEGVGIWEYFEELFCRHDALSNNPDFAYAYYHCAFNYYCKIGIMHVEIHIMLTDDIDLSAEYLKMLRKAYYDTKKKYPFFTVRIIGCGVKADSENIELTKKCFLNTAYAQETIKDEFYHDKIRNFVIGFDLVNEEDTSLPLSAFAPMLIKAKRQFPDMKLYIHGGESINAKNDNLIDAYLLGVSRVGHGLNLYRYPDLHKRYADSEICLEVCVVSNQILGYTKDSRNHPATEYLKTGVAISLSSDDPSYMENETLTDDFFEAILSWNLGIAEIKQLCINSIMYSGLDKDEKTQKLKDFSVLWNTFCDNILKNGI